MKFTLTYEGELRSNDDYRRKWEIRKQIAPQLEELWAVNTTLRGVMRRRQIPSGGYWHTEVHHSVEKPADQMQLHPQTKYMDLLPDIEVGGRKFFPLVRDSLALNCSLKITFLRKEEPGRVYQGGDLDNRLKTLFDALSVPNKDQIVDDPTISDPIYCLLENDLLIAHIDVKTDRLLSRKNASKHEVSLIIEVNAAPTQARQYNYAFLAD